MKLKRQILDQLEKTHGFELPETLVATEFDGIWHQLTDQLRASGKTLADEGKSEEEVKAQYRKVAERRVRLGLVVGEIGDKAQLQVGQEELRRALIEQARRYPGQERHVYEYYEKNPAALVELRAPIFEDKVIDHILEKSKPVEKKVSVEELLKPMDGGEPMTPHIHHGHDHDHAHDHDDHRHHDHDHHHNHDHHHHGHDHAHDHAHEEPGKKP
jgi:trigger factor